MKGIRTIISTTAGLVGLALILAASPAAADHVILDDCIIDGSLCVGFDCVNGENFGFDTVRLKENNLRLDFQDTSVAASFPDRDWRIVINDSANGGSEYFGVEDRTAGRFPFRVFGGARSNALVVDSQGDVGIGTSTPATDIHIKIGDTPTLRLEQDGTSGFAPQIWDVAGNETNFFIRDVTNGSRLPIRSRPDAPTSSIDVASDGDVGFGTASPSQAIHVVRSNAAATNLRITNSNAAAQSINLQLENDSGRWDFRNNTSGNFQVTLGGSGITELEIDSATGVATFGATIVTTGSCSIGCDTVFDSGYELEPIEQHAAAMWESQHLPAVGPTPERGQYNLTEKTLGMLNELETAHIYIEQLNNRVKQLEAALERLTEDK